MTAYLDASAILPTLIEEAGSPVVDHFMRSVDEPLAVSELAAAEVASAISRIVRTGLWDAAKAASRIADFDAWRATATEDIDLQASDVRLASIFVRRFDLKLRSPDALHAAICRRADMRLITLDKRLAVAARELGLKVQLLALNP